MCDVIKFLQREKEAALSRQENEALVDFEKFAEKLKMFGTVVVNAFTLDFDDGTIGIKLFKNGRAIIKNVDDVNHAKSLYTKYIEL